MSPALVTGRGAGGVVGGRDPGGLPGPARRLVGVPEQPFSSSSSQVVVLAVPADHPEAARLVAATEAELAERYQVPSIGRIDPAAFRPEAGGGFFVAFLEDRAVGCGGFHRHQPLVAELKRLYVAPEARRLGVARQLLARIEAAASTLGYQELWLETGVEQPEALALYPAAGYRPLAPFGARAHDPRSRFFGKRLGQPSPLDPEQRAGEPCGPDATSNQGRHPGPVAASAPKRLC